MNSTIRVRLRGAATYLPIVLAAISLIVAACNNGGGGGGSGY
jgi:predicted small secreted protein